MKSWVCTMLLAATLLAATAAFGQSFPSKPITLICPWPAGGSTDLYLRKLAELVSKPLGQPVIIENRPGGSGMNGPTTMAKIARPDGYIISQLTITAFRVPHMQKVDWDPLTDFSYIIGVAGYTFGIVVKADSPFKSFKDVMRSKELLEAKPVVRNHKDRRTSKPAKLSVVNDSVTTEVHP